MKIFSKNKLSVLFLIVILFVAVSFFLNFGLAMYNQYKGQKRVTELKNELERLQKQADDAKAADTVGGKTPQETLDLFIAAVEKGDYELASKYFVIEKQAEWKKDLEEVGLAGKLDTLLLPLSKVIYSDTGYFSDKKSYNIHDPVLVSFVLYPSGNWKIEEI